MMTDNLSYDVALMKKHKRVLANFCVANKVNPYQFLLVKLCQRFTNSEEVQHWISASEFSVGERTFQWFNNKGDIKNYDIYNVSRNIKQQLEIQKQLVTTVGVGGKTGRQVTLTKGAMEMLNAWTKEIESYLENQERRMKDAETIFQKVERSIETFDVKGDVVTIPLAKLDDGLRELLKQNGEEGYLKILQVLLANNEDLQDENSLLPIFFKVSKSDKLPSDYLRNGVCTTKGWITGHSERTDLEIGKLYICDRNETHTIISTEGDDIDICPYCSAVAKLKKRMVIPVREVQIETKNMDRFSAFVHAQLWNPSTSPSIEQNIVMFKMSERFSSKIKGKPTQSVSYLILGVEKEEEVKYEVEKAKTIAELPTQEIVEAISNSLFSDIAGLTQLKHALVLSIGSINTRELLINKKGLWQEERGILNTLFWGVEGTAKTVATQRLVNIMSHRLSKGQAGNTSARGLTAAYDKETNSVRAGIIPLNDSRVCLIDELDKFPPGTFQSLLEPLENKTLTYSKAGLNVQFPANTVIYMTANNINDIGSDCLEQLKKEIDKHGGRRTPVIDRCDIIVVIRTQSSGRDVLAEWLKETSSKLIPLDEIKNYYEVVRNIDKVRVDKDVLAVISNEIKNSNIRIMPRRLNSIIRLAGAIAKLHLRDIVNEQDAKDALEYYIKFLESIGEVNYVIEHIDGESKHSKIEQLILDRMGERDEWLHAELQIFFQEDISEVLESLKKDNLIFKKPNGFWRKLT